LRRTLIIPDGFIKKVLTFIRTGKIQEAITLCELQSTPISRIVITSLKNRDINESEMEELLEEAGKKESLFLNRYVEALGTIASIEPLLGLLGTVTGLIRAFQQVVYYSGEGSVDPGRLASGIWEALITTAAGLIIGIPCLVGYKYLIARVDSLIFSFEEGSSSVYHALKYRGSENSGGGGEESQEEKE
jgi:biopolymer transport protein ExbB